MADSELYILGKLTVVMRRRTPEEKKLLSYERDRRNTYGESPHGARKAIPANKTFQNRANRHAANQQIDYQGPTPDDDFADNLESQANHKAPHNWRKLPDKPLGEVVAHDLTKRGATRKLRGRKTLIARKYLKSKE